ncbi:MAG: hypothetical protein ACLFP1_04150 [Candidatus Goldiibacteriota bacterium]
MRKAAITLIFFMSFISTLKSAETPFGHNVKNTYELTGGAAVTAMNNYFSYIEDKAEYMGAEAVVNSGITGGNFNITFNSFFASDEGLWSFYITNHYFVINDGESVINYPDGALMIRYNSGLSADYMGIGVRKYTSEQWLAEKFNFYFGADAGVGTSVNTSFLEEHYSEAGLKEKELSTSPNGMIYGLNAEAGGSYWFNENIGVVIKGGYRYIQGRFTGTYYEKILDGSGYYTGEGSSYDVDYSGPFITAGAAFSFDAAVNKKAPEKKEAEKKETVSFDAGLPGSGLEEPDRAGGSGEMEFGQLSAQGNEAYQNAEYQKAAEFFEQALEIKEDSELYRKTGMSYFHMKNPEKTLENFEKYLEMKPSDTRTKNWIEDYRQKSGF